jgi:acetolactate synthase-1/2/3 large subunit
VACFTGDGGFLYHLPELETAVRYGVNTVTVVNNNNGFGQEGSIWGEDPELAHNWLFAPVSYAKLAEAFGAKAYVVEDPADLASTLAAAFQETGPVVVEVMTDIAARTPPAWKP